MRDFVLGIGGGDLLAGFVVAVCRDAADGVCAGCSASELIVDAVLADVVGITRNNGVATGVVLDGTHIAALINGLERVTKSVTAAL